MKKRIGLWACMAVIAVSMTAQQRVPQVTPDMAYNELNGGKVSKIIYLTAEGYDYPNDTVFLSRAGEETRSTEQKIDQTKRDSLGRIVRRKGQHVYDMGEGEVVSLDFADTTLYIGSELRPNIIDEGGHEDMTNGSCLIHIVYQGATNTPYRQFTYQEAEGGCYISYEEYNVKQKDQYGNWTKREVTMLSMTLGVEEELLKSFYPLFMNDTPARTRQDMEDRLVAAMKVMLRTGSGQVDIDSAIQSRKIEYYK